MSFTTNIDCIDSGTENCPCYLAATGDCLVCSRLQGKEYCDCLWKGVCIYNEFIQNSQKVNNPRKDFSARIVEKKRYLEDLFVITLEVGRGFALKAAIPGSYVFLQVPEQENYYHTPISIMRSDIEKGFITVLIKSISAKTKSLCSAEEKMIVRGVYRGGLVGLPKITGRFSRLLPDSKILLITKGVGFAPAINFLDWAKASDCQTDLIIDADKICNELIWDYLQHDAAHKVTFGTLQRLITLNTESEKYEEIPLSEPSSSQLTPLDQLLYTGAYTAVIVLSSDYYIGEIEKLTTKLSPPPLFVHSNNANICCGEGICGACSRVDSEGNVHKCCKCSL